MLAIVGEAVVQAFAAITVAIVTAGGVVFVAIISVKGKNASQAAEKSSQATAEQLVPNGGSSMADAVKRIEATIARIEERQMMTDREVRHLSDRIHHRLTPPYGISPTMKEGPS
jgi:DNA-directed RNA polymerase sigma subunit (sigma70/sigma32)